MLLGLLFCILDMIIIMQNKTNDLSYILVVLNKSGAKVLNVQCKSIDDNQ